MLLDNNGVTISNFIRPYYTDKGLDWFAKDQARDHNKKVNAKAPIFVVTKDHEFMASTNRFTWLVESVRVKDSEYWKVLSINLFDPDDWTYSQLRMKFDRHAKTFLSCLYWADLTKPVSFSIYKDRNDYAAVSLWQWWNMLKWNEAYNPIEIREQFKDLSDKERDEKMDEKFMELVDLINAQQKAEMKAVDNSSDLPFSDDEETKEETKSKKVKPAEKAYENDLTDYDDSLPF